MDFNGNNIALIESFPRGQKTDPGNLQGEKRLIREELTFSQAVIANGDRVLGPKLPERARILDAKLLIDASTGTGGIFDLGHDASEDGSIAADQDAFVIGADAGGQAVLKRANEMNVGIDKLFMKPVQLVATCTEATSAADGVKLVWHIEYVVN